MESFFSLFSYAPLSVSVLLIICVSSIAVIALFLLPTLKEKEKLEAANAELKQKNATLESTVSSLRLDMQKLERMPDKDGLEDFKKDMEANVKSILHAVKNPEQDRRLDEMLEVTNTISMNMKAFADMLVKFANSSAMTGELLSTVSTIHVKVSMLHTLMVDNLNAKQIDSRDVK